MTRWTVRPSIESDWQHYRDLRLEMLVDTPLAYLETVATAERHPEEHWRQRAGNASPSSRLFAAVTPAGRWIGTMGGYHPAGSRDPRLVGVYVAPGHRGREAGVADALLTAVLDWARTRSGRILLEVHEHNAPAIRYYERHGFAFTGRTLAYPLDRSTREREMFLPLS